MARRLSTALFAVFATSILVEPLRCAAADADGPESERLDRAREALASREWSEAVELLHALRDAQPESIAAHEAALLEGRAYFLWGKHDESARVLAEFLATDPDAEWAVPARLLLADALVAEGKFRPASDLFRERLQYLRGDEYLSWLVSHYLEIADPAYEGREVEDVTSVLPRTKIEHDYPTALEYYLRARRVWLPPERRNEIQFRIGHSYLETGHIAEAREELEALVGSVEEREPRPELAPDLEARALFRLGEAYESSGKHLAAIAAFARLEKEHGDHPLVPEAVARIASDYLTLWRGGSPESSSRSDPERAAWLGRAIETIDRFITRYPDHDKAPALALDKARALLQAGQTDEALATFALIVEKWPGDPLAPEAQLEIARVERERARFDASIAALERFLATFPTDSRWTEAKNRLVATLLAKADHLLHKEKDRDEARRTYERILVEYPLSDEAPLAYLGLFESRLPATEKGEIPRWNDPSLVAGDTVADPEAREMWAEALAPLRALVGKYESSPQAPAALFLVARILHERLDRLEEAISEYEALVRRYGQTSEAQRAREILAELRQDRLEIATPGVITSEDPWSVRVETRNLPRLRFKAYRLSLEEYFRRKQDVRGIADVEVGIVAPTKVWEADVPEYRPFRIQTRSWPLELPADEVGAYILTVENVPAKRAEKEPEKAPLIATTLVLRSNLAFVTKHARTSTFVWVFDSRTSTPVQGARVLLSAGGSIIAESKTGEDGVVRFEHETVRPDVRVLAAIDAGEIASDKALKGTHWAVDGAEAGPLVASGYSTKVHITTDRPVYRPEQTVKFRAILRKAADGQYASSEGEEAHVIIRNPLGVVLFEKDLEANEFGAIAGEVELTDEPPLGEYAIDVRYRATDFHAKFFAEEYRKPEFAVELELPRSTYLPGETVEGKITAEYLFGAPVAQANVHWYVFRGPFEFDRSRFEEFRWFFEKREPEDRSREGLALVSEGNETTDAAGELPFRFEPALAQPGHSYRVFLEGVDLTGIAVQGMGSFIVSEQGIFVIARAHRKVYRPGDEAVVTFRTVDADARPLDVEGEVVLLRARAEGVPPEEVSRRPVRTEDGKVDVHLRLEKPGEYEAVFEAKDRAGTLCAGSAHLHVAGELDESREARLLAEKAVYRQGEEATLHISSPVAGRHALLTFEASGVIDHRIVEIGGRAQEIRVTMTPAFSPNVHVAIAIPGKKELHTATDELIVLQYLDVALEVPSEPVLPGDEVELEVIATDQAGQPVEGEFSLAVVDRSIFELRTSQTEPIKAFFYDQRRALAVETGSSFSFHYDGVTKRIEIAVLAELAKREKAAAEPPAAPAPQTAANARGAFGGGRPGESRRSRQNALRDGATRALEENEELRDRSAAGGIALDALQGDDKLTQLGATLEFGFEGAKRKAGLAGASAPPVPVVRRRFADTAYWSPSVRTGADGHGKVKVTLPDNLTEWKVTAVGSSRGHLFGDAEASFRSTKDLLVRLAAPRFLTRADRAAVKTPIHNHSSDVERVALRVEGDGIRVPGVTSATVTVPPGGVEASDWVIVPPPASLETPPGGKLKIEAIGQNDADALEQWVPIVPFGRPERGGASGVLYDDVLHQFELPAEHVPGTAFVEVSVFPHHVDALVDTVLWLRWYPYGCVEQTVSGFLPLVAVAEALDALGTPRVDLRNEIEKLIPQRITKLLDLQRPSGGWGWWGGTESDGSDPQMTGLALMALERSRLLGYRVQQDRLERARAKAVELIARTESQNLQALLLYSLSLSKSAPEDARGRLYRYRERLGPYALGLLALSEHYQGRDNVARELASVLAGLAVELEPTPPVIPFPRRRPLVVFVREHPEHPAEIEAAAWALRALDEIEPASPIAARLAESLLSLRRGIHWGTTKASSAAVMALAAYYSRQRIDPAREITVLVNGEVAGSENFQDSSQRRGAFVLEIPEKSLATGTNRIEIRSSGEGLAAWTIRHGYFVPGETSEPVGDLVRVERRYEPLLAELPKVVPEITTPAKDPRRDARDVLTEWASPVAVAGDQAAWLVEPRFPVPGYRIVESDHRPSKDEPSLTSAPSGDAFTVRLQVEARSDLDYMIIEDPIPAGCEPLADDDAHFQGPFDRKEVRDEKVVFFATRLPRGTHEFSYRLRPVFPGSYAVVSTTAEGMYEPAITGFSSSIRFEIVPRKSDGDDEREPNTPDELLFIAEREWARIGGPRAPAATLVSVLERYRALERLPYLESGYRDLVLARVAAIRLAIGRYDEALETIEELRRRNPRLIGGIGDLAAIAEAYHLDGEFRLGVSWQSRLFDELYQRDRDVRDTLWNIGERLESQTVGLQLVRTYPNSNRVIGDAFDLARRYAAIEAPPAAREDRLLYREAAESLSEFISWFPTSTLAPQAEHLVIQSLANVSELSAVARESEQFLARYPDHPLVDEALYAGLEARFQQGEYDAVLERAPALIDGRFPVAGKKELEPSPFATSARWLLAKTLHILGKLDRAVEEYRKIEGAVPEARDALAWLTLRELEAPELITDRTSETSKIELKWKNLDEVKLQIYQVDLPLLFARRKDLRGISSIDLTGIDPARRVEKKLQGEQYAAHKTEIELPMREKGVWLVNLRAGELVESTVVIRSDLSVDVRRKDNSLQVFVTPPGPATVKVSDGQQVVASGESDARGFFEAVVPSRTASVLVERDGHFALWNE